MGNHELLQYKRKPPFAVDLQMHAWQAPGMQSVVLKGSGRPNSRSHFGQGAEAFDNGLAQGLAAVSITYSCAIRPGALQHLVGKP